VNNNRFDSLQLLALVPHRDARIPLRSWSASLFSAGVRGAWSFPWVMPMAALNRPLSGAELKSRAFMLRRALSGGKFTTGHSAAAGISDNVFVFGPEVQIAIPEGFFDFEDDAVIKYVSPLVIGAALCDAALRGAGSPPDENCPAPNLSFRAAALANMTFRPLLSHNGAEDNFSFEWEIGKLYWLPRKITDQE